MTVAPTRVEVPDAPYVHLFVPVGSVDLEAAGVLEEGDAVRLTAAGARRHIGPVKGGLI